MSGVGRESKHCALVSRRSGSWSVLCLDTDFQLLILQLIMVQSSTIRLTDAHGGEVISINSSLFSTKLWFDSTVCVITASNCNYKSISEFALAQEPNNISINRKKSKDFTLKHLQEGVAAACDFCPPKKSDIILMFNFRIKAERSVKNNQFSLFCGAAIFSLTGSHYVSPWRVSCTT